MQGFPKVKLIAVGKIKKPWIQAGIQAYGKRLPELSTMEIKDSDPDTEACKMLSMTRPGDRLMVLSEDGTTLTSIEFARILGSAASNNLIFCIGGPSGISSILRQSAHQLLSLSPMTFPHELARLLLVEQLYRAKTILQGGTYHK
ncbi:MAG: 23S rRNA (pseudouridine(1915)-N(3))-methyltransferase RlmH [Elainellaceae cyanobacterium]